MEREKKKSSRGFGEEKGIARGVKIWTGAIFAAFLAAAAVYLALLQAEKNMLAQYKRAEIYIAARGIPEGQLITGENREQFFQLAEVDARLVPETAIKDPQQVQGLISSTPIDRGTLLTEGMFRRLEEITAGMREPVVAGFRAEDLSQVVGGVLRAGDRIHFFASEEGVGTFLIWENVYVQQVFDSAGGVIESGDDTTAAQRINVFLDKEDVASFYSRLEQGSLKVVKIWK